MCNACGVTSCKEGCECKCAELREAALEAALVRESREKKSKKSNDVNVNVGRS
jgi:hypothetical protein